MKMKILSFLMGLLVVAASYGQESGTAGPLTWYFDGVETLTISGYGEMPSYWDAYKWDPPPWYHLFCSNVVITEGVTSISNAIANFNLITIPSSVTRIDVNLHNTDWYNSQPDGIIYVNNILYSYKGIMPPNTTINILDGTKSINSGAFSGCTGLTSIYIPESVTSIGGGAFTGCGITSITIPGSIKTIYGAFYDCKTLTSVTILEGVESIQRAFSGCSSLNLITIPNSVTTIGDAAFSGCSSLTSITIHERVTSIGVSAFEGCSGLTSISIPSSVGNIGSNAFADCENLTILNFNAGYCSDIVRIETYFPGTNYEYTMTYDAYPGWDNLQIINIGNNVGYIPNGILGYGGNFPNFIELNFNAEYCNSVGSNAFPYDRTTINIKLGGGVKHIPSGIFSDCFGLTSVTLPDSLESIGDGAFSGCEDLQSIVIPDNVTYVGNNAFKYCPNLTYAYIGNSVLDIGDYAFAECEKLAAVSLGESIETIGFQAFASCPSLRNIYCYGETPARCATDAFGIDEHEQIITYTRAKLYHTNVGDAPALYSLLPVWRNFSKRDYFDAADREITVFPSTNTAQVILVPNIEATAYDIVIYSDASRTNIVCILSFDAEGRLTGIALRSGTQETPFSCTIGGLKGGTTYYYIMTSYNSNDEVVEQKQGAFTTEGTTGIELITEPLASKTNIYSADGAIIVENTLGDIVVYDAAGRMVAIDSNGFQPLVGGSGSSRVSIPVPQAGVYIVQTDREQQKVIVR